MTGRLHAVVYRDTALSSRRIRRLGHPASGRLLADVFDHDRAARYDICEAVLDGMGRNNDLFRLKRRCEALVAAWLATSPVAPTVIVPDAQLLHPERALDAASWLVGFGADVWLCVASATPQALTDHAREFFLACLAAGVHVAPEAGFWTQFPAWRRAPERQRPWPRVPRVDGAVFRSWCQQLLEPDDFARVDAELARLVRVLYDRFPDPDSTKLRKDRTWTILMDVLDGTDSDEHLVIATRAAQIAGIARGWLVTVDNNLLLGMAHTATRNGSLTASGGWNRLDAYRDPDPGAAASLYMAGVDMIAIRALTVGHVPATWETPDEPLAVVLDDGVMVIDNPGTRFVRTLATYRRLSGAAESDPLFETSRKDGISPRHLTRLLGTPATELDVNVGSYRTRPGARHAETFVRHLGIDLHCLKSTWLRRSPR